MYVDYRDTSPSASGTGTVEIAFYPKFRANEPGTETLVIFSNLNRNLHEKKKKTTKISSL